SPAAVQRQAPENEPPRQLLPWMARRNPRRLQFSSTSAWLRCSLHGLARRHSGSILDDGLVYRKAQPRCHTPGFAVQLFRSRARRHFHRRTLVYGQPHEILGHILMLANELGCHEKQVNRIRPQATLYGRNTHRRTSVARAPIEQPRNDVT